MCGVGGAVRRIRAGPVRRESYGPGSGGGESSPGITGPGCRARAAGPVAGPGVLVSALVEAAVCAYVCLRRRWRRWRLLRRLAAAAGKSVPGAGCYTEQTPALSGPVRAVPGRAGASGEGGVRGGVAGLPAGRLRVAGPAAAVAAAAL
jgi:hypothetical protein